MFYLNLVDWAKKCPNENSLRIVFVCSDSHVLVLDQQSFKSRLDTLIEIGDVAHVNVPHYLLACMEAGCGLGSSELRTRPADILVSSWGVKDTAAFDITVTSPLSPKIVSEAGVSAGVAEKLQKNQENMNKMTQSVQSLVGSAFH
eukprot:Em0006g316a